MGREMGDGQLGEDGLGEVCQLSTGTNGQFVCQLSNCYWERRDRRGEVRLTAPKGSRAK